MGGQLCDRHACCGCLEIVLARVIAQLGKLSLNRDPGTIKACGQLGHRQAIGARGGQALQFPFVPDLAFVPRTHARILQNRVAKAKEWGLSGSW